MGDDYIAIFKLLIIGESGVGKSSIMQRFIEDVFDESQSTTIGVDFKTKIVSIDDGTRVKLTIWDTAGQERFRTLTPNYYRGAHGAILVYDVTNKSSFQKLELWLNELDLYETLPNMAKMMVGNKIDQSNRQVSRDEGVKFAKRHKMMFVETSAKTNENIKNAFDEVVRKIMETDGLWDQRAASGVQIDGEGGGGGRSRCC